MGTECVRSTSPVNFWLFRPSGQSTTTTVTTAKSISTTTTVATSMAATPSATPLSATSGSSVSNSSNGAIATSFNSATPRVSSLALAADVSAASGTFAEFVAAPSSSKYFAQHSDSVRHTSSFPNVDTLSAPDSIKVRLENESTTLNSMNVKVPRNVYHEFEMCRQQWRCAGSSTSCCTSQPTFFTPQNDVQSDSEGDDSLVSSSEEGGCSSADGIDIVEHYDDDEDLGVVRDLELYDRDIDANKSYRFHNQQQQYLMAAGLATTAAAAGGAGSDATTPLVGSPSSATVVASSTMMAAMAAAAATIATPSTVVTTASTPASNVFNSMQALSKKQLDASINRLTILAAIQSKKAVRFADECGKCLETVRVMTEPSDYPPLINPAVIRRFRKAASLAALAAAGDASQTNSSVTNLDDDDEDDEEALAALKAPRSSWKITFRQPASEYVKFRETLEHQKVALENVMLKNDVGRMVGTIKVSNVSYEKRVFLRYTADEWKTYTDRAAVYQSSPSKAHDTFRFDIEIPRDAETHARIEFCVCFEANGDGEGQSYWDSNEGKNYVLTASDYDQFPSPSASSAAVPIKKPMLESLSSVTTMGTSLGFGSSRNIDAYNMNYDNWAKFASWRNLRTDTPYW